MRSSTDMDLSDSAAWGLPEITVAAVSPGESASGAAVDPVRHGCNDLLAAAAAVDEDGAWGAVASAIGLANDPGAAAPLVEAVAEVLALHGDGDVAADAVASLRAVVSAVLVHPSWRNGTWRRTSNPSRRGGRHTGNVQDHPLLSCLVADRRATVERSVLNRLRLVIVLFLVQGGEPTSAVATVADAVRKAESMEAWRQVVRAMPCPDSPALTLANWLGDMLAYLHHADPPAGLAQVPAVSIRALFVALQALIRHVTAQPARPQLRRLFDDDDAEARGAIRPRALRSGRGDGDRRASRRVAVDDSVTDRRRPVQEVLVFGDGAQSDDPTTVALVTELGLAPLEQPQSNRAARLAVRLGSYRLTEITQRLQWSWDHLNPLDIEILTASIRADFRADATTQGTRWRGGALCAVMLGLGRSAADALRLCVGVDTGGDDWIDAEWRWHRRIHRPPKAWTPNDNLLLRLATASSEIALPLQHGH